MKQGLEDVYQCVRDGYAAALGALLALGLNPQSQVNISARQSMWLDVLLFLILESIVHTTACLESFTRRLQIHALVV